MTRLSRVLPTLLVAAACSTATPSAPESPPAARAVPAPSWTLEAGGSVHRVDRAGLHAAMTAPGDKVRVYNVWATWCGPCIAELPTFEAFADAHAHVELWYVNADHPKVVDTRLRAVLAKHDIDDRRHLVPVEGELDITGSIPDFPQVLPVTYIVEPSGTVRDTRVGAVDLKTLSAAVAAD